MLKKLLSWVRKSEIFICSVFFATALVVLTVNVIFRRVSFLPALDWAEEYMRYCSIWITFLGMSLCAEDDLHVGVDIVYQVSPTKIKKVLKIICMLAATVFGILFTWACITYVGMALRNMQRSPVMRVPLWIVYMSLPIGSALTAVQYALKLVYYCKVDHKELAEKQTEDPAEINLLDLS